MKAEYSSAGGGVSLIGVKNKAGCTSKRWTIGIVTTLLLLGVIAVIVYFAVYHKQDIIPDPAPKVKPERTQVDCLVDHVTKTKAVCDERPMCSWDPDATVDGTKCTLNSYKDRGYMVQSVVTSNSPKVTKINLRWTGEKTSLYSKPGDIITNVTVEIHDLTNNMLRIKIVDADDNTRYEVPVPLIIPSGVPEPLTNYNVIYSAEKGGKFSFQIERKSNSGNKVVFDTSMADIVMENQYLSLTAKAPTSNVYGFGENIHRSFRHQFQKSETWAMLARDQPPGQDPNQHQDNLYGVHNFYVCIEDGGEAHGVFLFNSNIQDVTLSPGNLITYRTIGGILDYYVFMGPSPENVIQQYTGLIGRPYMPPYWALGFQLCRYGYRNTSQIREAVERTRNASIPHDVQYADIDYMDGRKDFTIDPVNFGDLADYFRDLRQNHSMKTIIILDPALSIEANYPIYPQGKAADIYIKWPTDGSSAICDQCEDNDHNMFGYVWPDNKTAFPDFFRQSTWNQWGYWIEVQSREIDFDGLWIDMNEPAAFDTNKDKPWNWDTQRPGEADWNLKCDMSNPLENPPYKTKACHIYEGELRNISDKTLCMVGLQGDSREYTHYDVHNLYGWSQSEPTLKALRQARTGKRGMVITRSTFAGSGKFAGHWLGDNTATWQHLRDSIIGMLEFNMFGIPYVGADICGFFEDSNAELCMRWMQLGAFYPFSRNHNGIDWLDHDPASFSDEVAMRSREALEIRYELLPYLYTLFYQANKDGSTVVRSLQFQWPEDTNTYDINEQFLWGDGLLFSPVLYQGQTEVDMYVPKGMWYDYQSGAVLGDMSTGRMEKIQISETTLPIHIRGGVILPLKTSALTTTESRKTNFRLYVALNEDEEADGLLFWDDGDSVNTTTEQCLITFEYKNKTLTSDVLNSGCKPDTTGDDSLKINNVRIMGLTGTVQSAVVGGTQANVDQDSTTKVTIVDNFTHDITRQLVMVLTFT